LYSVNVQPHTFGNRRATWYDLTSLRTY
jgi:hypothetical protein